MQTCDKARIWICFCLFRAAVDTMSHRHVLALLDLYISIRGVSSCFVPKQRTLVALTRPYKVTTASFGP